MPHRTLMKIVSADDEPEDTSLAFEKLDGLLGYRLRRAQGAMHRDYMAAVAGLDLTQKQTATLWLIHANPGTAQVSVAASLGMDRATMMSVINRLEERRLVVRKRSTSDKRRQELSLTAAGNELLDKLIPVACDTLNTTLEEFSREEVKQLQTLLRKLLTRLEVMAQTTPVSAIKEKAS